MHIRFRFEVVAAAVVAGMLSFVARPAAADYTLFDGSLASLPAAQGKMSALAVRNVGGFPFPVTMPESLVSGGVMLDSDGNSAEYAGYSNYDPFTAALLDSGFPVLDRTAGFTLTFSASVANETSNANRAGLSVLVVTSDTKAIELGFKASRIFAQSSVFLEAEDANWATSSATDYALSVLGSDYELYADGDLLLSGVLRDYVFNPATSDPPLPLNPYDLPNFVFLGDDTGQGAADITFTQVALTGPLPEPATAALLLAGIVPMLARRRAAHR